MSFATLNPPPPPEGAWEKKYVETEQLGSDFFCKLRFYIASCKQPRPQGLLLDDFQNGGSTGEDLGNAELTPLLIGPFIQAR